MWHTILRHGAANNNGKLCREPKVRAAKISKTTPCKVTGRRQREKQLDLSGKSPAYLHHPEIL
jgi:hypothetical protein